jgi:GH18 family chitinase
MRIFLTVATMLASAFGVAPADDYKVVAYVPNWIDLAAFTDTIEFEKVTHLNVAFENPITDVGDLSFNSAADGLIHKAHARGVKVLVSIGGGSASGDKILKARYAALLSRSQRKEFAARITAYVDSHEFDGLDVDIEGPSINDDYAGFIATLSENLRSKGKLLTAALSKGYGGQKVPDSVFEHFDFVNIMAYDARGYWDRSSPGQHSSLEFAETNVEYWLSRGLPKEKAVLGVPFYGYGFGSAFRKRDYPYSEIVTTFAGAELRDKTGDTIWYNGIPTIRAKAEYVRKTGLAGVMIWSLDYDVKGERSLLGAIHSVLQK